jgi:adenylate cyclase
MAERFPGGAEVEVTILFADIRGSTSIAERMKPADFSLLIKHFYQVATRVLFDTNAIVEKLVGDAVTGFYTPGFTGPEHAKVALDAASQIIRSISGGESAESRVPVGIGLHTGIAYVGSVTTDSGVANIAILGDAANVCARLASLAGPGEIYLSQATADAAGVNTSELQHRSLELKGRMQAVDAFVFLPLTTLHQSGS